MVRSSARWWLIVVLVLAFPRTCPAPLVYRPGEGWAYETPGSEGKWTRARAKDQLEVAQQAFDQEEYGLAMKASKRVVKVWPLSDYAPTAQMLLARTYEAKGNLEKAFKEYQNLLQRYPKFSDYQGVLNRQFEIANQYLAGRWFRLWGVIPFGPSMQKTVEMYEKVVNNGPYSPIAPAAQMNIGAAREQQSSFFNRVDPFREAVVAYETAADRYHDKPEVASTALFKAGVAYFRQASKADYDQSVAAKATATFNDFVVLYPNDPRVPEAQAMVGQLRSEQARGNFAIAEYYERKKRWAAASIYYNEAWLRDPNGPYAEEAKKKLDYMKSRVSAASP